MNDEKRSTLNLTSLQDEQRTDREVILETNRLVHKLVMRGAKTIDELEHSMRMVDQKVSVLEFSSRTESALTNAGIETVRDLLTQTQTSLLQYESIGRLARNEIVEVLALHGLRLAEPSQPISLRPHSDRVQSPQQNKTMEEHPIARSVREKVEPPPPASNEPLKKGDVVRHPTKSDWGIGRVQSVTTEGVATILFAEAGEKNISVKHVQLDVVRQVPDAPPLLPTVDDSGEPLPGKVLCSNCGQPTVFTENASSQRYALGWCDACFKHSQRTFKDSVTGETRYFDELRTVDGIRHKYYSPK